MFEFSLVDSGSKFFVILFRALSTVLAAILSSNEFARKWITSTLHCIAIDVANLRVVLLGKVAILIVDAKAICPTTFTFDVVTE